MKNTDQKNICVSIVFKGESKPKHEGHFFGVFFSLKNQKRAFQGSKIVVFKIQILNLFFFGFGLLKSCLTFG